MEETNVDEDDQEAFLSGTHVGVIRLTDPDRGPLTAPIWYIYEPGGLLWFSTGRQSLKGKLIAEGTRLSLCAQDEAPPYKYVSVEGPVVSIGKPVVEEHLRPLAHRYLGEELGNLYTEANSGSGDNILVAMKPERWLTVDYAKEMPI